MTKPYSVGWEDDDVTLPVAVASCHYSRDNRAHLRKVEREARMPETRTLRKKKITQGESVALEQALLVARTCGITSEIVAIFSDTIRGIDGKPVPRNWRPMAESTGTVPVSRLFCVKFRGEFLVRLVLAGTIQMDADSRLFLVWTVQSAVRADDTEDHLL